MLHACMHGNFSKRNKRFRLRAGKHLQNYTAAWKILAAFHSALKINSTHGITGNVSGTLLYLLEHSCGETFLKNRPLRGKALLLLLGFHVQ